MDVWTSILLGIIAPFGIELLKKVGYRGKDGLAILAVVAGAFYTLYLTLAPADLKNQVTGFIGTTMTTAILVYELLLKVRQQEQEPTNNTPDEQ